MNHLTEEQLGALADGALDGGARAAAERHLESCAACREALAGVLALDGDLRGALEHDPGEAYFADFAARVGGRIRAAGLRGAQARAPGGPGLADWFRSPRKLAALGAVATVVAGLGLVMLSTREVTMPVRHGGPVPRAVAPAVPPAGESAPPAEAPAPAPTGAGARKGRTGEAVTTAPAADRLAAPPVAERAAPPPSAPEAKSLAVARDEEPAGDLAAGAPVTQAETPPPAAPVMANEAGRAKGAGPAALARTRQALSAAEEERGAAEAFAGQPTFTSLHGRNALRLTRLAETMRVAPAWDSAAEEWAMVLLGTAATPLEAETRYQLARARWRAWTAGATGARAAKAGEAFAGFLASAPAGARRDSVQAWQATVGK